MPCPPTIKIKTHSHENEWEPEEGFQRNAFTVGANILTAIGFCAAARRQFIRSGAGVTWREGLLWGLAGFVVFTAAPGLGLPLNCRACLWLI